MKFEIDRNSWHYKLNTSGNGLYFKENFEEKYSDFCSYWRITVWHLFLFFIAFMVFIGIPLYGIYAVISNPYLVIAGLVVVIILAILYGLHSFLLWSVKKIGFKFQKTKETKVETKVEEPKESLIQQKLYSWKHKFCAKISYK